MPSLRCPWHPVRFIGVTTPWIANGPSFFRPRHVYFLLLGRLLRTHSLPELVRPSLGPWWCWRRPSQCGRRPLPWRSVVLRRPLPEWFVASPVPRVSRWLLACLLNPPTLVLQAPGLDPLICAGFACLRFCDAAAPARSVTCIYIYIYIYSLLGMSIVPMLEH